MPLRTATLPGADGGLPEKLVWDRAAAVAPAQRPSGQVAAFYGDVEAG